MAGLTATADEAGRLEVVCHREGEHNPRCRAFAAGDEFGVRVEGLEPGETVTVTVESDD